MLFLCPKYERRFLNEVISRFKKLSEFFMDEGYYEIAKIYRNVTDIFEDHYAEESF